MDEEKKKNKVREINNLLNNGETDLKKIARLTGAKMGTVRVQLYKYKKSKEA